ncbi:MAG: hypothetical protein LC105_06170 [Chitinophagales bacterium]|nr:hypothetical protein [Chitinophagales bacterium]
MADNVTEFIEMMSQSGKSHIKVQTAWATVKSVDWNKKTMTATGVRDGLDYYNVSLGVGAIFIKPKSDTLCLIGMIENKDAAWMLLDAKEAIAVEVKVGDVKVAIDGIAGKWMVNNEQTGLKDILTKIHDTILNLKVNTPSGPSVGLLPDTVADLGEIDIKINQLLMD